MIKTRFRFIRLNWLAQFIPYRTKMMKISQRFSTQIKKKRTDGVSLECFDYWLILFSDIIFPIDEVLIVYSQGEIFRTRGW